MTDYNNIFLREEYISRINKVQDYIEANIGEELSLALLSNVANFSQYHFHRIFCAIVGEPLSKYIQRIRLERAALSIAANPKDTIFQIALRCGFSNQASFSRAFKKHFGFSARELRRDSDMLKSKKCKVESKTGKDDLKSFPYNDGVKDIWSKVQLAEDIYFDVEVKETQEVPVIYIRNVGMFNGEPEQFQKILGRLMRWANARGLVCYPDTKILSIYHDNPDITDENRLRASVCMTVQGDPKVGGEIGKMTIPGGKYAVGHFMLEPHEFKGAWDYIYGIWLPGSGYQPDDRPNFEVYLNNPDEHPDKKSIVDIYVPVKPF